VRRLADVRPGAQARALGAAHDKDPRLVELILGETAQLVRADRGRLICRTHHGFVCANAGIDQSNAGGEGWAVLLPADPDASARALRRRLGCAVVISDSFGRAWRLGQAEVAIGCAGLAPLEDWRGRATATAASCTRRTSASPTRPPRPPTSCGARTRASPRSASAGSSGTSCRRRAGRGGPPRAAAEDLFG
jgi:coenzyme F420-0:L-glutamate ligase/coenzyme F420-1:gamma-L-glutamate ligase